MFEIYQNEVLGFYRKQVENGTLSHLSQPSPGILRAECIRVYAERPLDIDHATLRSFFGVPDSENDYTRKIEILDLDRFRPLRSFMIGDTQTPQRPIVEILAWLINFEHRPYPNWVNENLSRSQTTTTTGTGKTLLKFWQTPSFISGGIIAVFILCAYLIWYVNFNTSSSNPKDNQKCMYWTGNHFEPIDCNIPTNAIKEHLDIDRLHGFKKILVKDLLTKEDIGKVYVTGTNEGTEYFTQNGSYPGDSSKSLRPLSIYVLAKYSSFYRFLIWAFVAVVIAIALIVLIIKIVYKRCSIKEAKNALPSPRL